MVYTDLQNRVSGLRPTDTPENPYYYTFRVQCTSCHETHPNWVSFNRFVSHPPNFSEDVLTIFGIQEQHEIPGSRGEANFVWKCRLCTVCVSSA